MNSENPTSIKWCYYNVEGTKFRIATFPSGDEVWQEQEFVSHGWKTIKVVIRETR